MEDFKRVFADFVHFFAIIRCFGDFWLVLVFFRFFVCYFWLFTFLHANSMTISFSFLVLSIFCFFSTFWPFSSFYAFDYFDSLGTFLTLPIFSMVFKIFCCLLWKMDTRHTPELFLLCSFHSVCWLLLALVDSHRLWLTFTGFGWIWLTPFDSNWPNLYLPHLFNLAPKFFNLFHFNRKFFLPKNFIIFPSSFPSQSILIRQ